MNVSEFIIGRLSEWGVQRAFGTEGVGISGIIGAMRIPGSKVTFIDSIHEETGAFMASAHAKFTGDVAVCVANSGSGAIRLLNGLYDAKLDHQSVVAIIGQQKTISIGSNYQQEVDLVSLFKDVASEFVQMIIEPSQARHVIDRALRIAKAERSVTCVIIPVDIQERPMIEFENKQGVVFSGVGHAATTICPNRAELQKAAEVLNKGERVAILVGAGAVSAGDQVVEVAEILGAGIAKALLGKAVIPDDLPFVTGTLGLVGTRPSWDMMNSCDTLLMIGSSFPYSEFLPLPGQAKGVQVDIDGKMLSLRYPMEVCLLGDAKEVLIGLIPLLAKKVNSVWSEKIKKLVMDWKDTIGKRSLLQTKLTDPKHLFLALSAKLPENCVLAIDSGPSVFWFAQYLDIKKGMKASLSGNLASKCASIPYALAGKMAFPDRGAVAVLGESAMQTLGINALFTVSRYWPAWSNPCFVILVLRPATNSPEPEGLQLKADSTFSYATQARQLGLEGVRIENFDDIDAELDRAFLCDRPIVLEVLVNKNIPMLSRDVTWKDLTRMNESFRRNIEDTEHIDARKAIKYIMGRWDLS